MYFSGSYDTNWISNLRMRNTSSDPKSFSIKFFDKGGSSIYELPSTEINPFGLHVVELQKFPQLKEQKGLFIIRANYGIKGEQYVHSNDGAPLRTVKILDEGLPPFSSKNLSIFISYTMTDKNNDLYGLVSRFVKAMGFTVLSATESKKLELPPGTQISNMISGSDAIIAILTKDTESKRNNETIYLSNPNVTDEIGQGRDLVTIILVEDGIEVPSNIQTRSTYSQEQKFMSKHLL